MKNTLNKMTPYLFFGILIIYILNGYKIINTFEIIFDRHVNTKLSGESKFVDFFYFIFSVAALCISCFYYLLIKLLCRLLPIGLLLSVPIPNETVWHHSFVFFLFRYLLAHPRYSLVPAFPLCLLSVRSSTIKLQTLRHHLFSQFSLHFHTSADTKKIPLGTQNAYRKNVRLRG